MTKQEQSNKLVAFVCDPQTKSILDSIELKHLGIETEVHLGEINVAVKHLQENRSPRILLVDLSGVALPVSAMQKLAEVCEPGVEVIAIGDRNEVGIFRSLIDLGVQDYIAKPINPELLVKDVEKLILESADPESVPQAFSHLGKVVSFIGARGGVGTSTVIANCATSMAGRHLKRVSLIDFDRQLGVQARLFDLKPSQGLRELFENPDRIDPVFVERSMVQHGDRLSILSTEEGLNERYSTSPQSTVALLNILKEQFNYLFLDIPRHFMTAQSSTLFQNSDTIVIMSDLTLLSIRDTVRLLKLLAALKKPVCRVLVVANRVGAYKQGELPFKHFEEAIERKLDHHISFDSHTPLVAQNMGKMLVEEGGGVLAKGIEELVEVLLGRDIKSSGSKQGFINSFLRKKA